MSASNNWDQFMVRINVRSTKKKLYESWATKTGIEYWFLRQAIFKKADGSLLPNDEFVTKGNNYSWLC